jgi:dsDNA-specific endonuclease/ATPase MutS2
MWLEVVKVKALDREQREQVGFSFIIDELEVMTAFGAEEKNNIKPYGDKIKLQEEFDNIEMLIHSMSKNKGAISEVERVFCRVKDLRATLKRCSEDITLDDVEIYEIKYFSLLMDELVEAYKKLKIEIDYIKLHYLKEVFDLLDPESKKISTFYIYDSYSERLKNIRYEKKKLEGLIFKESNEEAIKTLKDKRLEIVILEQEEELGVRKKLTEKLSSYVSFIEENMISIGKLDLLLAKCKLALKYKGIKPSIEDSIKIRIKDMFNPQIVETLQAKGKEFTTLSIDLSSGTTVITGANMGGKSVAIKTLVLNLFLFQLGFFVFAKEVSLPVLDFIYFISDDMQSVAQGLSTFGAEIVRIKDVIKEAKKGIGFIGLDEFARGTNPKEGFYLVKSLCKYLNIYDSITLISTHYDGVADEDMVHYQVVGLKNADLSNINSLSSIQEHMNYSLEKVSVNNEVPKDALNVAMLLGLQDDVLDIARKYYEEGYKGGLK